jgi:hypothetical protein
METKRPSAFAICGLALALASVSVSGCDASSNDAAELDRTDAGSDPELRCPDDIPEFFAGPTMGTAGIGKHGLVKARILEASHIPPLVMSSENTWTVQLTDMEDAPLEDVAIAQACLFMTVHRHGVSLPGDDVNAMQRGQFELKNMNFFMRGPWEIELAVNTPAEATTGTELTDCDRSKMYPGIELVTLHICLRDD